MGTSQTRFGTELGALLESEGAEVRGEFAFYGMVGGTKEVRGALRQMLRETMGADGEGKM